MLNIHCTAVICNNCNNKFHIEGSLWLTVWSCVCLINGGECWFWDVQITALPYHVRLDNELVKKYMNKHFLVVEELLSLTGSYVCVWTGCMVCLLFLHDFAKLFLPCLPLWGKATGCNWATMLAYACYIYIVSHSDWSFKLRYGKYKWSRHKCMYTGNVDWKRVII